MLSIVWQKIYSFYEAGLNAIDLLYEMEQCPGEDTEDEIQLGGEVDEEDGDRALERRGEATTHWSDSQGQEEGGDWLKSTISLPIGDLAAISIKWLTPITWLVVKSKHGGERTHTEQKRIFPCFTTSEKFQVSDREKAASCVSSCGQGKKQDILAASEYIRIGQE